MLSVSSEFLDQLVTREKYLQSTFESLSGAELAAAPGGCGCCAPLGFRSRGVSACSQQVVDFVPVSDAGHAKFRRDQRGQAGEERSGGHQEEGGTQQADRGYEEEAPERK